MTITAPTTSDLEAHRRRKLLEQKINRYIQERKLGRAPTPEQFEKLRRQLGLSRE